MGRGKGTEPVYVECADFLTWIRASNRVVPTVTNAKLCFLGLVIAVVLCVAGGGEMMMGGRSRVGRDDCERKKQGEGVGHGSCWPVPTTATSLPTPARFGLLVSSSSSLASQDAGAWHVESETRRHSPIASGKGNESSSQPGQNHRHTQPEPRKATRWPAPGTTSFIVY